MKLPTWTRTESTNTWREELPGGEPGKIGPTGEEWTETSVTHSCDDPTEMAFHHRCMMQGFNLPEFDGWLAQHPESDGKRAQLATRALAKAAASHWELRAHLQVLNASRQHVDRVDYLKPKAARDERRQEGTRLPRGGRAEALDAWLDLQDLSQSAKQLWRRLERGEGGESLSVTGELLEVDDHPMGFGAFQKRVTKANIRRK